MNSSVANASVNQRYTVWSCSLVYLPSSLGRWCSRRYDGWTNLMNSKPFRDPRQVATWSWIPRMIEISAGTKITQRICSTLSKLCTPWSWLIVWTTDVRRFSGEGWMRTEAQSYIYIHLRRGWGKMIKIEKLEKP